MAATRRIGGQHHLLVNDVVTIRVMMPDAKSWWRNFAGDGAPHTLDLDGTGRTGQAVARRDSKGRVTVTVHLDGKS